MTTPTETVWTIEVVALGGMNLERDFRFVLPSGFFFPSVELAAGERSAALPRVLGRELNLRADVSRNDLFDFIWRCQGTGANSVEQTSDTSRFTPVVNDDDGEMNCVFEIDNRNPPQVTIQTEVLGDDTGNIAYDYSVDYRVWGQNNLASYIAVDATEQTLAVFPGSSIDISATPRAGVPPGVTTTGTCRDSNDTVVSVGFSGPPVVPGEDLVPGAAITCVVEHRVPATLTIIEQVTPDPAVPNDEAASYSKNRFTTAETFLEWTMIDEGRQSFELSDSFFFARFTRAEVRGWDVESITCVERTASGVVPFGDFSVDLRPTTAELQFGTPPGPGVDLECTFNVVPAPPPALIVGLSTNVFDSTTVDPVTIEVLRDTGSGPEVIATLPPLPADFTETIVLPDAGDYSLQLLDAYGLVIAWSCAGTTSALPEIGFSAALGDTIVCGLDLSDELPPGSTTLTLTKDEDPDSFWRYGVTLELDGLRVAFDNLFDDDQLVVRDLPAGTYTVTEVSDSSYELLAADCDGVLPPVTRTAFDNGDGVTRTGTFTLAVPDDGAIECMLANRLSTEQPIVRVVTQTVPAGSAQSFDYEITPIGAVLSGSNTFDHVDGEESSFELEAFSQDEVVVTQGEVAGFDTTVECYATGTEPTGDRIDSFEAFPSTSGLGIDTTCIFVNTATVADVSELTLGAVVDVGPIVERPEFATLADGFAFDVAVTGDGVVAPSIGTTRNVPDLDGTATAAVDVASGTPVTIDVPDELAGIDGFEYVIDCGTPGIANAEVTIVVAADTTCEITFRARTLTINKFADPQPPPGFTFGFEIEAEVGGYSVYPVLADGDTVTVVVPLRRNTRATEGDFAGADPPASPRSPTWEDSFYDCTELDALSGLPIENATFPFRTGPFAGGSVSIPADATSYDCDVYNGNDEAVEVITVTDLGVVPVPAGFPTFDIVVDQQLDYDGGVVGFSESIDLDAADARFVFAYQDAEVTIDPGVRSELFDTSISCDGYDVEFDGPITIDAVPDGGLTCVITNRAANITVEKTTAGPVGAGDSWLFEVDQQLAIAGSLRLGAGESFTVAVPATADVQITEIDPGAGVAVRNACGPTVPLGGIPPTPTLGGSSASTGPVLALSATGATARSCTFENTASTPPTTVPPTTVPPTTVPPTTVPTVLPPPFVPTAVLVPATPSTTTPPTVTQPTPPTGTQTTTSTTTSTTVPPTSAPTATTEPVTIVAESGDDVFVELNEPFVVDTDCDGELVVTVNGIVRSPEAPIESTELGIGDHIVEVVCDGELQTSFRAVVYSQEESDPSGSNMTVIVLFVVIAAGAIFLLPAAAGTRRGVV